MGSKQHRHPENGKSRTFGQRTTCWDSELTDGAPSVDIHCSRSKPSNQTDLKRPKSIGRLSSAGQGVIGTKRLAHSVGIERAKVATRDATSLRRERRASTAH